MVSLHLILLITSKEKYNTQENSFSFTPFSKEDILKAIKSLSRKKHLQLKTFLLRSWKIQFISTQKNLVTFSMNAWLT